MLRFPASALAAILLAPAALAAAPTPEELARYQSAAAWSASVNGNALLVMKDGAVVFEDYIAPVTAFTPRPLASGTKSFSAAIFALGAEDGLWTLDEIVSDTITEWAGDPRKSQVRIRDLLTLSSGLQDSPDWNPFGVAQLDIHDLAINESTAPYAPGEAFLYGSTNFVALSVLYERKTGGGDAAQYLHDRVLSRLAIPQGQTDLWTRDINGKPQVAGGASYTARAWGRYGQLWLQGGEWNGEQLLDADLLQLSAAVDNPAFQGYGFTWWRNTPIAGSYDPLVDSVPPDALGDGEQMIPGAPGDILVAAGLGKQRLYIIPSEGMVVVRFGSLAGHPDFSDEVLVGLLLGLGDASVADWADH